MSKPAEKGCEWPHNTCFCDAVYVVELTPEERVVLTHLTEDYGPGFAGSGREIIKSIHKKLEAGR